MNIPYYYRIGPRLRKPSVQPDPKERAPQQCPQCGKIHYTMDSTSDRISGCILENAAKWPEYVNSIGFRGGVFSRSAMEQIKSDGLNGARFIKIEWSTQDPSATSTMPTEDYFALAALQDISINLEKTYRDTPRCTVCGEPSRHHMHGLSPIAKSGNDADFCAIKQYPERDSDKFYWLVSWRVVRLILKSRWRNVYVGLLGAEGRYDLDVRDVKWPFDLPSDFVLDPENSVVIDN